MAKSSDFGEIKFDLRGGREDRSGGDAPFRILILGNFSGRRDSSAGKVLALRKPRLVDRDNFDEVLAKAGVTISLPEVSPEPLSFAELDDFHPDRLFERAAFFQKLRALRQKLANPSTYAAAARELGVEPKTPAPAVPQPAAQGISAAAQAAQMAQGNLLEDAIGATEDRGDARAGGAPQPRRSDDLAALIRRAVEPYLVEKPDPRQAELLGVIDQAASAQMRALLHLPDFQLIEAAWRAVWFLARRVETGASLKIYLLDVSKEELQRDVSSADDLRETWFYRMAAERQAAARDDERWALMAGNYMFGTQDTESLARIARIAHASGAPFIAGASPALLGCGAIRDLSEPKKWRDWKASSEGAGWRRLRSDASSRYLGLILPRFLLRLPYGKLTDAVAQFDFEEMPAGSEHEDYLWGNPAFLCASLIAGSFERDGWSMQPGDELDIEGLPLHIYKEGGESTAKPCAEALLTEQAAVRILEEGIMPLASMKGKDSVRLVRLQSIADPVKALAGRWE